MTEKIEKIDLSELFKCGEVSIDDIHKALEKKLNEIIDVFNGNQDHQQVFAVGEYYSFTTYRKDYDADANFIFKVLEIKNCGIRVCEYDCHGKNYEEYVYDSDSEFLKGSKPATAEQVAEFKLAEAIAKTGQSADQIRQMLSNGKMPMGPWLELQKTAEELQEVADNE